VCVCVCVCVCVLLHNQNKEQSLLALFITIQKYMPAHKCTHILSCNGRADPVWQIRVKGFSIKSALHIQCVRQKAFRV
jgi:hypothetical protein